MEEIIDRDTGVGHISPAGLEHHTQRLLNKNPTFYSDIKMRDWIVVLHQQAFPELAEQMRADPNNAVNIYSAFLAILPLQVVGRLTPDERKNIMKTFKVI
jgi:hypothetical protein